MEQLHARLPLPQELSTASILACVASSAAVCASLEGEGPRVAGCREAAWSACAIHPPSTDPQAVTPDAADEQLAVALAFADTLVEISDARRGEAESFRARALDEACAALRSDRQAQEPGQAQSAARARLIAGLRAAEAAGRAPPGCAP